MSRFDDDITERLRWDQRYTNGHVPLTLEDAAKEIERLRAQVTDMDLDRTHNARERDRLRAVLRDLLDAYLADVNPNDRNETAIEHARRNIQ